jgi:hypothetical protein
MVDQMIKKVEGKLGYIETSALLGKNVDFAFSTIANLLYKSRL